MKITSSLAVMFFVLLSTTIVPRANGQEVKVVFPNALENVEGNSAVSLGGVISTEGMRYQAVLDASQFSSVQGPDYLLTAMLLRPDGAITMPFTTPTSTFLVRLSITDIQPGQLDLDFDSNIGTNETTVYQGEITFSSDNLGPPGGPKLFDYGTYFQTPFHYDPSEGNLLYDLTVFGTTRGVGQDADDRPTNLYEWVFAGESDATRATARGRDTGIFQLVFVPEPVASGMVFAGTLALLTMRRRSP